MYQVDDVSLIVSCSTDMKWQSLEFKLNIEGYTLGYLNPRYRKATVRDLLEKDYPNILRRGYGQPRDWCLGLTMAMASDKTLLKTKTVPRSAAGPDFRGILVSSGRAFGRVTTVSLRIHRMPDRIDWHLSRWKDRAGAQGYVAALERSELRPHLIEIVSDTQLLRHLHCVDPCLVILRFAGVSGMVQCYMSEANRTVKELGGAMSNLPRAKVRPIMEKHIGVS